MTKPICHKCEQEMPEDRVKYLQALWEAISGFYPVLKEKEEIPCLEVVVRIDGEVKDAFGPITFWELLG